ncbi:MAG: DedA family protein [Bdellovibrio sp.]|nr:DedA family protein [Bdellovibrio sp.]
MLDRIVDLFLLFSGPAPYLIVFGILLLCGLGLPVPEDITLAAAGFGVYLGLANLWTMILVAYLGIIIGDSTIFFLGATLGRRLTQIWFFRKLLPEKRLADVRVKFNSKGNRLIFMARFMPGLRAPIYFSAGMLHLPYRVFLFYDGMAALISVPVIISVVDHFGDQLAHVVTLISRVEHGIVFVIASVIFVVVAKWYLRHRGKRKSVTKS